MTQITFDKLKQNCVQEFCFKNTRGNSGEIGGSKRPQLIAISQLVEFRNTGKFRNPRVIMKEIEDDCVAAIERTDIRNIKALVDLCPESIPKWIKSGNYVVDLTDNGWTLFKK